MATEKKLYPLKGSVKLYDAGGDLSRRWYVYWRDISGKLHKRSGGMNRIKTKTGRYKAGKDLVREIERTKGMPPARASVADEMLQLVEQSRASWRKKTYQSYKSKLTVLSAWLKSERHPDLTEDVVKAFSLYLQGPRGLSATTVNQYVQICKDFYSRLRPRDPNPFDILTRLPETREGADPFPSRLRKRLRDEIPARDPQLWLACQFVFYCFIRPGELRNLRVSDLDLEEGQIRVGASVAKNKKRQHVRIPAAFLPVLEELAYDLKFPPGYYIFSGSGKPGPEKLGTNNLSARHQKLLEDLFVDTTRYKFYSWKYTGAIAAVKSGVSVKLVQMQLRHASLDQVNQYLTAMGAADLSELVSAFPEV